MNVYISSDHAGFEYKGGIAKFLKGEGYEVFDLGPSEYDESDDYPDYIKKTAEKVSKGDGVGIVLGGSGQGEAIVSNRYKNVRAIVYNAENKDIVKYGREHNNANVLSIGARFVSLEDAKSAVLQFLQTSFTNEDRHIRRIKKIDV